MIKKPRERVFAKRLEDQPPETLRALCALSDVRIDCVRGLPARTWRLSVSDKTSISLQTVEYDAWVDAIKILLAR